MPCDEFFAFDDPRSAFVQPGRSQYLLLIAQLEAFRTAFGQRAPEAIRSA